LGVLVITLAPTYVAWHREHARLARVLAVNVAAILLPILAVIYAVARAPVPQPASASSDEKVVTGGVVLGLLVVGFGLWIGSLVWAITGQRFSGDMRLAKL
jgi:hypothetical protein